MVSTVARIDHPEATVLHRPGLRGGPSLEDSVQPDVDPRVVELVNELPPPDRKIAILKIASGCAWSLRDAGHARRGRPAPVHTPP